jgi:hypothetical protein
MHPIFELLSRRTDTETYEPGEPIFREGEAGSIGFLLLDGEIALEREGEPIGRIAAGELFGESALLGEPIREATARALTAARVVPLGPALYRHLLAQDATLGWSLRSTRGRRLRRIASAALASLAAIAGAASAAEPRRVFVTSVTGDGDLSSWPDADGKSGLAAGDAICQARAVAGSLPNPANYRAWLSSASTDAYCHVQGLTGKKGSCQGGAPLAAGPWYLSNGITHWAANLEALTGEEREIYWPALRTELHDALPPGWHSYYWTGTDPDGTGSNAYCGDWESDSADDIGADGDALGTSGIWTFNGYVPCHSPRHLLCLETGPSIDDPVRWGPGAIVFVTSVRGTGNLGEWPEADGLEGLDAGDAICRNLASAARLPAPSSFSAWLSTSFVDARDRTTVDTAFRRIDGYPVAFSRADLLDGATGNSIHVDERGRYLWDIGGVWTGTAADGRATEKDCEGWEVGTDSEAATRGFASRSRYAAWTEHEGDRSCNGLYRLYCVSDRVTLF